MGSRGCLPVDPSSLSEPTPPLPGTVPKVLLTFPCVTVCVYKVSLGHLILSFKVCACARASLFLSGDTLKSGLGSAPFEVVYLHRRASRSPAAVSSTGLIGREENTLGRGTQH